MNLWLKIDKINYQTTDDILTELKKKNFFVSPWIEDIFSNKKKNFSKIKLPVSLFRVKLSDMGFEKPKKLQEFYKKSEEEGFNLVTPELALITRELYVDQPTGEWLRFATPLDSMIDSDGVPHLPKLGKALNKFFIETYWSYPKAIFHPHNEFILKKK